MKFSCPHCGQMLEADAAWYGQNMTCPTCSQHFAVPQPQEELVEAILIEADPPPSPVRPVRPPTSYRPKGKQGGIGAIIMWLAGLVVAAFFGVGIINKEPPQKTVERCIAFLSGPAPAPTPGPTPELTPVPVATPEPTAPEPVAPEATPEPTPRYVALKDPIAWLSEHPDMQPKTVVLTKSASFPVMTGDRVSGTATVPKGTAVNFKGVSDGKALLEFHGGTAQLPFGDTDLLTRTRRIMVTVEPISSTSTEAAAPAAAETAATPAAAEPSPEPSAPPAEEPAPADAQEPAPEANPAESGSAAPSPSSADVSDSKQRMASIEKRSVKLEGETELHLTGEGDVLPGSTVDIASPDAWLFFEKIPPAEVEAKLLDRVKISGQKAKDGQNVRLSAYGPGTVVIPHGSDFEPMEVFDAPGLSGKSVALKCYVPYGGASLKSTAGAISSFRLKRGYTATIATEENGGGTSKNYVAQDRDIEVKDLPEGMDKKVNFVRIFPWRWTGKKGVAGGIGPAVNAQWFYNWNISDKSTPDVEYVPIAQKRGWPSLKQDWKERGASHLLGYNEPDHKDQSNLTVDAALEGWPELLATGLRVGSPAVSDGGLGWLYQFIDKADAAKLRVDFVAVHYYRAVPPSDAKAAAEQFRRFLTGIHERTKRPIWVTEWNNGANWTKAADPSEREQKEAIEAMVKMLDETPFVERYAIYNWVEDCRAMVKKDNSLTPAGEVYRDTKSPPGYVQAHR